MANEDWTGNSMGGSMTCKWTNAETASEHDGRDDSGPHRAKGATALIEEIPTSAERILDLGTGDGRLLSLILHRCERSVGVAIDSSPAMLAKAKKRFGDDDRVHIIEHDLARPLPDLRSFDAVVSGFAMHHLFRARKRELYREIWHVLVPGGVFCNLEHVGPPLPRCGGPLQSVLRAGRGGGDRSDRLLDVATQLRWLDEIGFQDVACLWEWRKLALLAAVKPGKKVN